MRKGAIALLAVEGTRAELRGLWAPDVLARIQP
jgi:hypothetical protein